MSALEPSAFPVERLAPDDLVALAQCVALDATAFPYASLPVGAPLGPDPAVWVARDPRRAEGGRPVRGFVVALSRSRVWYIQGLAVAPEARRQGVGRALLRTCVNDARARRSSRISLHVAVDNAAAVSLYASEGFEVMRRVTDFYRPGVPGGRDAYEMTRRLQSPLA